MSGLRGAPVAGAIIDHFGFTVHYLVLAAICLFGLVPLSRMTETVSLRHDTDQPPDQPTRQGAPS